MGKYDEYKERIFNCCTWLSTNGYFGPIHGSGGNVSMRIKGENAIAITPTSIPYKNMTENDICIVDLNLDIIEGNTKPSMETGMHLAIYEKLGEINSVVHTHQTFASLFAAINEPIPIIFDEVMMNLGTTVDVIPYAISGSKKLASNVKNTVNPDNRCYTIQNHGSLSLGKTIDQALLNTELLEKSAKIQFYALAAQKKPGTLPASTIEQLGKPV